MIEIKESSLIKKFDFASGDNVSYLIKTLLMIIARYKKINIYITTYEKKSKVLEETERLLNEKMPVF